MKRRKFIKGILATSAVATVSVPSLSSLAKLTDWTNREECFPTDDAVRPPPSCYNYKITPGYRNWSSALSPYLKIVQAQSVHGRAARTQFESLGDVHNAAIARAHGTAQVA